MMNISLTDAKARLTDLVRRAEAGEEVILTRRGEAKVRLVAVKTAPDKERRRRTLTDFTGVLKGHPAFADTDAAHVDNFLYDDRGLPN